MLVADARAMSHRMLICSLELQGLLLIESSSFWLMMVFPTLTLSMSHLLQTSLNPKFKLLHSRQTQSPTLSILADLAVYYNSFLW